MNSKSILIEKYIEPSEIEYKGNGFFIKRWFDRNEDLHSFMGHPAETGYCYGKIMSQNWYKKGVQHRGKRLPAEIWYHFNGQIEDKIWHNNGKRIKL